MIRSPRSPSSDPPDALPPTGAMEAAARRMRNPERLAAAIVLGLLLVLLLLLNGGGWIAFRTWQRMLETELENRLATAGQVVATALDPATFPILSARTDDGALDLDWIVALRDDPVSAELLTFLERARDAANLRSISLVTPDARVVADPDDPAGVGEVRSLLFLDAPEMERAVATREAVAGPLYPVGEVIHKRVYVPLVSEDGGVALALLRLEASSGYFAGLDAIRAWLRALLVVSTFVLAGVSFVLYGLIRRLLLTERAASQADRLRSLGALAAGFAHEVRNPLAIIRLTCEELRGLHRARARNASSNTPESDASLASADPDTDSPEVLVADIQEEVSRLEGLVEQFLAFARPEAMRGVASLGPPADPVRVVHQVARLFEKSLPSDRIALTIEAPEERAVRVVLGDKGLSQVLLNLLRNAAEAMGGETGAITIRVHRESPPSGEGGVVIEVADTGPGMTETVRRQACDPFFSTREGGTGLGLALARRLVESSGGAMELRSRPDQGTTVAVRLPVANP